MARANPAKVLHDHLAPFLRASDNDKVKPIWAETFGLELPSQEAELLESFALIIRLPNEIRRQVGRLPDTENKDKCVVALPRVEAILALGLTTNCASYKSKYDKEHAAYLDWTADALARAGHTDPNAAAADLEELLADVADLGARILSANDLPDFLRQFLLRALDGIRQALRHYRITGSSGLLNEIDRIHGHMARLTRTLGEEELRTAGDTGLVRDFGALLARIADLTTFAAAPAGLIATAQLLGLGG